MAGERLQNIGEQLLRGAALGGPRYANGVGIAVHRRIQSGGHGGDAGSGGTGRPEFHPAQTARQHKAFVGLRRSKAFHLPSQLLQLVPIPALDQRYKFLVGHCLTASLVVE